MPIYETGHARNVQRFEELVTFVAGWGAAYNPSNAAISLVNLQAKLANANSVMDDVAASLAQTKTAVNERENIFAGLGKLCTRAVNYYASTGTAANMIEDARSLNAKIQGKRSGVPILDDPNTPEDESLNSISASQQSYTQRVEHFDGIIELFNQDALYAPNETDLQIAAMQTLSSDMKAANTNVIGTTVGLSNSRGERDDVMYAAETGLVDLALTVKKYVKAAFGTGSMQFNHINSLEFRRPTE